jgi:hypothetical protein
MTDNDDSQTPWWPWRRKRKESQSSDKQHPSGVTIYPVVNSFEPELGFSYAPERQETASPPESNGPISHAEDPALEVLEGDDGIPEYHRSVARPDGREDEEYYKDVENLT